VGTRTGVQNGLEKNGMVRAWHGRGMASVNQTRPHCVNQMGKTHSKLFAVRHGRGTAWTRHAMCESALRGGEGPRFRLDDVQGEKILAPTENPSRTRILK
jgi:hypothetical protein